MKIIKELVPYVLIVIFVVLLRTFIITPVRVDGASMDNTLKDGQVLLLYKLAKVNRYDIVVVDEENIDEVIIKRVYGMPGDTIEINHNSILINGKVIDDQYGVGKTSDYAEITLKDDEYFVLGDNREVSKDSRYFGTVKESEIKGQTIYRLWPFTKLGKI